MLQQASHDVRATAAFKRHLRPLLWILAPAVIAILGCGVWWWLLRSPPLRYVTARVTRGSIQRAVTMTGALNPVGTAQVGSYVLMRTRRI